MDHNWTLQLLREVDDEGENLSRREIDFIARLIDEDVQVFTREETRRIRAIYNRRMEGACS